MRSHAMPEDERSPVSPRLTEPALAVFCGRLCAVRSTVDNRHVRTQAFFQLPINRPLVICFSAEFSLGAIFREHFASVSLALPLLFVSFYFKVIFNALF
jgi:hypothetical protein